MVTQSKPDLQACPSEEQASLLKTVVGMVTVLLMLCASRYLRLTGFWQFLPNTQTAIETKVLLGQLRGLATENAQLEATKAAAIALVKRTATLPDEGAIRAIKSDVALVESCISQNQEAVAKRAQLISSAILANGSRERVMLLEQLLAHDQRVINTIEEARALAADLER